MQSWKKKLNDLNRTDMYTDIYEIEGSLHIHGVNHPDRFVAICADNAITVSMYNCGETWSDKETHIDFDEFLSKYKNEEDLTLVRVEWEVKCYYERLKNN